MVICCLIQIPRFRSQRTKKAARDPLDTSAGQYLWSGDTSRQLIYLNDRRFLNNEYTKTN